MDCLKTVKSLICLNSQLHAHMMPASCMQAYVLSSIHFSIYKRFPIWSLRVLELLVCSQWFLSSNYEVNCKLLPKSCFIAFLFHIKNKYLTNFKLRYILNFLQSLVVFSRCTANHGWNYLGWRWSNDGATIPNHPTRNCLSCSWRCWFVWWDFKEPILM